MTTIKWKHTNIVGASPGATLTAPTLTTAAGSGNRIESVTSVSDGRTATKNNFSPPPATVKKVQWPPCAADLLHLLGAPVFCPRLPGSVPR